MHWFLNPIKNHYADFSGRTGRKEFWMYVLSYVVIYVVIALVASLIDLQALTLLFSLAVIVPSWAITARRLHDINMSGWWQLIGLVPLIGLVVIVVLTAKKGDAGPNKYDSAGEASMASGMGTASATMSAEEPANTMPDMDESSEDDKPAGPAM